MKKLIIILGLCFYLSGCGNGATPTSPESATPVVNVINFTQTSEQVVGCLVDGESFVFNITGVNNIGYVVGNITANTGTGCMQHGFTLNQTGDFNLLPFKSLPEIFNVKGFRADAISTNMITGGITFATAGLDTFEFATYIKNGLANIITADNYVFGISENGKYLLVNNIGGQGAVYDTDYDQPYSFTYGGIPVDKQITFISSSNTGLIGGYKLLDSANYMSAILCRTSDLICRYVDGGDDVGYDAIINAISPTGKYIFGFKSDGYIAELFSVNPSTLYVQNRESEYIPYYGSSVTDDGDLLVTNFTNDKLYLYTSISESMGNIYSIESIVQSLGMNVANMELRKDAYLSPNGKYLALNTPLNQPITDELAYVVYFPYGIESYVMNNLTPLTR